MSRRLPDGGLHAPGVFTIATSTILRQAAVRPRWPAVVGYGIAALLLVAAPTHDRAASGAASE